MQFKQEHKIYFVFSFWMLVLIVGIVTTLYTNRTVTHNYYDAALDWLNHIDLYNSQGAGFIYFPQSAIFYIPLDIQVILIRIKQKNRSMVELPGMF